MDKTYDHSGCQDSYVIIPAYQPSANLVQLTTTLDLAGYSVVIIDDGSEPKYDGIWQKIGCTVLIHHPVNLGKGAALKTGFEYIRDCVPNAGCIITMDADGQHLPEDMEHIAMASWTNPGALILGSRNFDNAVPLRSKLGNTITRFVFSCVSRSNVRDTQTGLRAFDRSLLKYMISIKGERYEYEMNVLLHCGEFDIPIIEVPIRTVYLDEKNSCSHFDGVEDSFRIYKNILKFASSSLISFFADYLLFLLIVTLLPKTSLFLVAANVTARAISATLNYILNTKAVFGDRQPITKTLPQYILLAGGILAANSLVLSLLVNGLHLVPVAAKIMTELVLFFISFSVQSALIFKKPQMLQPRSKQKDLRKAGLKR